MRILDGQAVHTATDLADFLECEHLTALGRRVIAGELQRPYFDDPMREVLAQKTEPWLSAWGADDWGRRYAATVSRPWDHEPTPLQLALARGHRWLAMLELGKVGALKGDSEMGERFGH